jgi:hypothetical protein
MNRKEPERIRTYRSPVNARTRMFMNFCRWPASFSTDS